MTTADIVVAGAGHNSLITAAYLARAGRNVVVLEEQAVAGGGAVTQELLLAGYLIDSCSTGHTLIQGNPLFTDDELGLFAEQGLEYIAPDPVAHVVFPDGAALTMWLDEERTVEEIARYSRADADAYRRMLAEWRSVSALFRARLFSPVGSQPPLDAELSGTAEGRIWLRRKALSAWDVIRHEFEERHVRAFLCWQAFQTLVPLDAPGSGTLPYSILAGRQTKSWTLPRGGSGRLSEVLVNVIEDAGGSVLVNQRVAELIVRDGRCRGVRTASGDEFVARDAVVSTIHVKHLLEMAPRDVWGEDFVYGVETFDVGISAYVVYLATTQAPQFGGGPQPVTAVAGGFAGWPEDVLDATGSIRRGRPEPVFPSVLVATPTVADPSRAPEGHHTVKILCPQAALPSAGRTWAEVRERFTGALLDRLRAMAPNMASDVILAEMTRTPADIEAANAHMIAGTFHGGDRAIPFAGKLRPAPGWAQHRLPLPGLYQTGGTTHPGGSITGAPGRNAAMVVLRDLGTSLDAVVGKRTGAR